MIKLLTGAFLGWVATSPEGKTFANDAVKKVADISWKVGKKFLEKNNLLIDTPEVEIIESKSIKDDIEKV